MRNLMKLRQYDQHRTTDQIEMGENAFMDLDYSEFKALMMKGRRRPKGYRVSEDKIVYLNITDLPENVDWRGKAVPKVPNELHVGEKSRELWWLLGIFNCRRVGGCLGRGPSLG
jgi:hypothetical protein